jgi:hypothetical protein
MTAQWINQLGDWNPQFLRECRGRLKTRNVIVAIGGSLIFQLLLFLAIWNDSADYATRITQWLQIFRVMAWILPYFLFTAGSYTLVGDIIQEDQRGTLDFIRLSPRSSQSILLGKLLGAPILFYLTVATAIPLHFIAAFCADVPLGFMVSYYVLLLLGAGFVFNLGLIVAFLSGSKVILGNGQSPTAISFSLITIIAFAPLFMTWNRFFVWRGFGEFLWQDYDYNKPIDLQWIYFPINENLALIHVFTIANLLIGIYFCWTIMQRRFQNPTATVLSKKQSYGLVAYLQILVLGFFLRTDMNVSLYEGGMGVMYGLNFMLFLALISTLSPSRQLLLDWYRYERHPQGIWGELIWAEKSPSTLAIVLNLIIAYAIIIPWVYIVVADHTSTPGILVFASLAGILLIYALLVQRIFATKIRNPAIWAIGTVATGLILPPITLGILRLNPDDALAAWTFFGYSFARLGPNFNWTEAWIGLIAQWVVIAVLGLQLARFLHRLGQVESH